MKAWNGSEFTPEAEDSRRRTGFSPGTLSRAIQVGKGLAAAHAKGIVHRVQRSREAL